MKRALVLSGGGSKGSYQTGAIMALADHGKQWNSVHGVSVGAINALYVGMHRPEEHPHMADGLAKIWERVKSSDDVYKPWAPFYLNYIASMWKGSLNSGAPLRKFVNAYFDHDKLMNSGVVMNVGTCSITTGKYHSIDKTNPKIFDYVLASSHLPVVFEPLLIDGNQWVDGGIRHQIPILEALKESPDEIDIIITSPISIERVVPFTKPENSGIKVALRAADILADQAYINDYFTIQRAMKDFPNTKFNLYAPSEQPNDDSMNFDHALIQHGMAMGYQETHEKLIGQ